jgi:hypothetical protein
MYHTCNASDNLLSWTSFDALRFKLSLYERSGCLIFGSDHPGVDFKSIRTALGGVGTPARRVGQDKRSHSYSLATHSVAPAPPNAVRIDLRSQRENEA